MRNNLSLFKKIGPGIIVAATGVGAGDLITVSVAGAKYGYVLLWAVVLGGLLKYVLNEGISRWQLSTNTSVLNAWQTKYPKFVSVYFLIYLILWTFIVSAALMAACGLAGYSLYPDFSVTQWGIAHALVAFIIVYMGKYRSIEALMKFFIGIMFIVTIVSAILSNPDWAAIGSSIVVPRIPVGSVKFILGVIGGVGGSVTLLSYGYWMREKAWKGKAFMKQSRLDLSVAYLLTALFGISVMIIAGAIKPEVIESKNMVVALAEQIELVLGSTMKWIFLIGFWGAVFSSMIGVWHGVPYLFADYYNQYKKLNIKDQNLSRTKAYRWYLGFIVFPPMIILFLGKPVWLVILYAVTGAFFMPFLAASLLYMNNKIKWLGEMKNKWLMNGLLGVSLILFVYLLVEEIVKRL